MLTFAELKPGRMYGLSFAYLAGGEIHRYEMRGLMTGMDESANMPIWRTAVDGAAQRLVIPREWMTRLIEEKNKPPYLRRVT
jgi:hypothetical protein